MYKGMKDLWDSCVIRREANDCEHWPEDCGSCILVEYHMIKLPRCWEIFDWNRDCIEDKNQLATLIHAHITGNCKRYCLFCEIERIPI
jgi:hypothetical protein